MNVVIDEKQTRITAREMSFHILKNTILSHFVSIKHNKMVDDEFGTSLVERSERLMDIFIEEAYSRSLKENKPSLSKYKKEALEGMENLYAKGANELVI